MITAHCVMVIHAESIRLPFNDFCRGCRSTEEKDTVIYFLCQCPSFASYRHRLFRFISFQPNGAIIYLCQGYSFVYWTFWLVLQREVIVLWCAALVLTNLPLFTDFGRNWSVQRLCSHVVSQRAAICPQVSFVCLTSELQLRPESQDSHSWT